MEMRISGLVSGNLTTEPPPALPWFSLRETPEIPDKMSNSWEMDSALLLTDSVTRMSRVGNESLHRGKYI